jgi:osmotically-inducible protein OsmY
MNRNTNGANQAGALLAAAGVGAALMYFLDPSRGAQRRSIATDRAGSLVRTGADEIQRRTVQARDQLEGVLARTRSQFGHDEATDMQLAARVRAELGHHTQHTRAIEVIVRDGIVTLRGDIPADDLGEVLRAARRVRGVGEVHDELNLRAHENDLATRSPLG